MDLDGNALMTFLFFCTLFYNFTQPRSNVYKEYNCYMHKISEGCLHADCSGNAGSIDWIGLGKIHNLCSLNISYNSLRSLPPELFDLPLFIDLKYIDASHNYIEHIPPAISDRFVQLNVSHNHISDLPKVTKNSITLKHLDAGYNNLTSIGMLNTDLALKITSKGNPMICDSHELILPIWERMVNKQLDPVMCMENGTTEMKLITNVASYQKLINDKTNESKGFLFSFWFWLCCIVALFVALIVIAYAIYRYCKCKEVAGRSESDIELQ